MYIPSGYGQINWIFSGAAAPTGAQVTLGYSVPSGGGTADEEAEFFWDVWRDEILPNQIDSIELVGCLVKHGPNETGPSGLYSNTEAGGTTGQAAPPNTAYLVQKRTAMGGRRGRGRLYVPGVDEDAVNGSGGVIGTVVTALQTGFDELFDRMTTADANPMLLHATPGLAFLPNPITAFSVQGVVATQRQRLRR